MSTGAGTMAGGPAAAATAATGGVVSFAQPPALEQTTSPPPPAGAGGAAGGGRPAVPAATDVGSSVSGPQTPATTTVVAARPPPVDAQSAAAKAANPKHIKGIHSKEDAKEDLKLLRASMSTKEHTFSNGMQAKITETFMRHAEGGDDATGAGAMLRQEKFDELAQDLGMINPEISERLFLALDDDNTGVMECGEFIHGMRLLVGEERGKHAVKFEERIHFAYRLFDKDYGSRLKDKKGRPIGETFIDQGEVRAARICRICRICRRRRRRRRRRRCSCCRCRCRCRCSSSSHRPRVTQLESFLNSFKDVVMNSISNWMQQFELIFGSGGARIADVRKISARIEVHIYT